MLTNYGRHSDRFTNICEQFRRNSKFLSLSLVLLAFTPSYGQMDKIMLTQILEEAATSSTGRIRVQNAEILTSNLKGHTAYEYIVDKYRGTGALTLDSGRIVIDKRIDIQNSFLHRLELSGFKFEKRLSLTNCTILKTGSFQPWISFKNCRFTDLRIKDNILRDFFLTDSQFSGELMLWANSGSSLTIRNNRFGGKALFYDNWFSKGIEINKCIFEATAGECLAKSDTLTYDRPLENNIQLEYYSNLQEPDRLTRLSIEKAFSSQNPSAKRWQLDQLTYPF